MFGVVVINGAAICFSNNRRAFLSSLVLLGFGFVTVLAGVTGHRQGWLDPFPFMVLLGLGMYVPYVAFHTTIFERLIAAFRESGNIGYLMYLADAVGYTGYVGVMVLRNHVSTEVVFLRLMIWTAVILASASLVITALLAAYYMRRLPRTEGA